MYANFHGKVRFNTRIWMYLHLKYVGANALSSSRQETSHEHLGITMRLDKEKQKKETSN